MRSIFLLGLILTGSIVVNAQNGSGPKSDSSLYHEILELDKIVFSAFNAREVQEFARYFSNDLEFFHDKGGLTGYKHTVDFLETLAKNNSQLTRELLVDSLIIYPIPGYGAMQIGAHRFCNTENGVKGCSIFKFVHIWKKQDNQWKITRVVSYGH